MSSALAAVIPVSADTVRATPNSFPILITCSFRAVAAHSS
jgi:hypothetical protein